MYYWIEIFWNQPFLLLYAGVVVVSLIKYRKYFDTPLRFFPVVLMYNLLTEILGVLVFTSSQWSIVLKELYYNNNWLIYNIYAILYFLYFLFVYRAYMQNEGVKTGLRFGIVAYFLIAVVNFFLQDFVTETQLYSYMAGGLLILVASGAYLVQEFGKNETRGLRKNNLLNWLSLGNFIFYLGYLPIKYVRSEIADFALPNFAWIRYFHLGLIYVMYGCFLVGFLIMGTMKKPNKTGIYS